MELHQIRYFLALCEELNFTRAAERCGVAQSSLTRAIKALEAELGAPLFHRGHVNSHLSRVGAAVRPSLAQAYRLIELAERDAAALIRTQESRLRVGLMRSIAPALLVEFVAAVRATHPEMTLQFSEASLPALQERLLARDIDIAVYGLSVPVDDARFDHLFLYRERFVVVVGTTHPLARCDAISFGDLKGETCLGIALDGSEHDEAPSTVATSPGPCRGREDWIMAMAAAGLGYGIVPEHAARPSGVVAFTPPSANLARDIVLATLPGEESAGVLAVKAHAARANWRGAQSQRTVDVELLALTETTAR